jgi:brefeldin A-resistance guanine nucleotide exchange factor 1
MKSTSNRALLTSLRTNEAVIRGTQSMSIIYQMSSRVPHFIEQSHLETNEGNTTA